MDEDEAEVELARIERAQATYFRDRQLPGVSQEVFEREQQLHAKFYAVFKRMQSPRLDAEELLADVGQAVLANFVVITADRYMMVLRSAFELQDMPVPEGMEAYAHEFFDEAAALLESVS